MAKRKRLTPARPNHFDSPPETKSSPVAAPPIAQVARDSAATAALETLSDQMARARAAGLMLETLPLDAIEADHLVRDRLGQEEEDMAALMASLEARGQQTPIEVTALPGPGAARYGLISGWRRLMALRALHERSGEDRFATVKALITTPETAQAAYVAMVEENEIRVGLSLYERAHIAWRAVQEGVYPTPRAALQGLYASVSRSRRSKIGSLLPVVEALGAHLRFGPAIPEKLGLALAKALEADPDLPSRLSRRLRETKPDSAEAELRLLSRSLTRSEDAAGARSAPQKTSKAAPATSSVGEDLTRYRITGALELIHHAAQDGSGRLELTGAQVNDRLLTDLKAWLEARAHR